MMGGYTKLVMGGYLEGSMHPFSKGKSFGKGWHSNINRAPPISSKFAFESSFFVYYKVEGLEEDYTSILLVRRIRARKAYWVVIICFGCCFFKLVIKLP